LARAGENTDTGAGTKNAESGAIHTIHTIRVDMVELIMLSAAFLTTKQ